MKKLIYTFFLTATVFGTASAQRGNNQLGLGVEAGFPTGSFNSYQTGIGINGKAMLGTGTNGQVTISIGYTSFKSKNSTDANKFKTNIIPIMVGYRYNASILYIEPKVGLGIFDYKNKSTVGGMSYKSESSQSGFAMGLQAGVQVSSLDISAKYQIGFPSGGHIGYFGIGVGYNVALKRVRH